MKLIKKQNVVIDIPDVDATTDQPTPDTDDQSETNEYKGFLDLGFMHQAVVPIVPLNVVYPGSCLRERFLKKFMKELIVMLTMTMIISILE